GYPPATLHPMDQTASLVDLRAACTAAGLPTYGTKEQLLERLNEAASRELSADTQATPADPTPEDADAAATTPLMQQTAQAVPVQDPGHTYLVPIHAATFTGHSHPQVPCSPHNHTPGSLAEQFAALGFSGSHNKGETTTLETARAVLDEVRNRYPQ